MCRIICVTNHKGGVGKTTTTINLGAGLKIVGDYRVLLVDMDPQANLSYSLGITKPTQTTFTLLTTPPPQGITKIINKAGMDIIPSSLDLAAIESMKAGEPGKEFLLRELLEPLRGEYDYILIDCPPSLGLLTINSLTAADEFLVPIQPEFLAVQGLTRLLEMIALIRTRLNSKLECTGIVITQYDGRKVLHRTTAETIRRNYGRGGYGARIFESIIPDTIVLAESQLAQKTIFQYSLKSKAAETYAELSQEVKKTGKKMNHRNKLK
jgi:chromosome partitioning protein